MTTQTYRVQRASVTPELQGLWEGVAWRHVPALKVDHFHEISSDHRPVTEAKLAYDDDYVYVIFRVNDQYVRSLETEYHSNVCRDSCVEFFFTPSSGTGYFNIETNCGGVMLLHFNKLPLNGTHAPTLISEDWLRHIRVYTTMPRIVDPEITTPVTWLIEYAVPVGLLEAYAGPVRPLAGSTWHANFYKCASIVAKPHWAMWNPIPGKLNFHKPEHFAPITFV